MYIALGIMLCGILAGRLGRRFLSHRLLGRLTMLAIFLLLFLLGVSIGANERLFERLPELGGEALALALLCLLGSIACSAAVTPYIAKRLFPK